MDLHQWLANAQYWHWAVAGFILLVLEAFAPGAIFMWLGIAALAVSLLLALIPMMSWEVQWFLFSVLSVVSIIGWKMFFNKHPMSDETQPNGLNQRGKNLIGSKYTLSLPIENGHGRVQIGDSWWRIEGPDLPPETVVAIVESKGSSLIVAKAD